MKFLRKQILSIYILGMLQLVWIACRSPNQPGDSSHQENIIYENSFENAVDTIGFQRTGAFELRSEAAPECGNQALFVSGSCIVPHVYFSLPPLKNQQQVTLKCWGKNLAIGGLVSLYILNQPDRALHISVQDSSWKKYTAQDTLMAAAQDTLAVEMFSGGYVPSAILVDCLKIIGIQ